jgi:protoporphyrinogen oxidase
MTIYILGAGPTGMAVVDGLVDAKACSFIMLEKGQALGGLAQTMSWDGVGDHDLGPHKIFSRDKTLVERVEAILPKEAWLTRRKISTIYMRGHYLPYPPSPLSLARVFGLPAFIKMVVGYGFMKFVSLLRTSTPKTFAEDLEGRLGRPLYKILFKPIAEKLWGDPKKLDAKLSKGRVQTPSLWEILCRLMKIQANSEFEAVNFRYPRGGLGSIWRALEIKSQGQGKILLSHTVTSLVIEGMRVRQINFSFNGTDGVLNLGPDDMVVSTLPLAHTVKMLRTSLPENFQKLAEDVVCLNDLLLVFLNVDKASLLDESWVFIPDPSIAFHRLSEQESFDPAMTPNGSIVCCEIMSSQSRPMFSKTDDELISLAVSGLHAMGYSGFTVLNQKVMRLKNSYPVFHAGFESGLSELIGELDKFDNFRSIGRQGAFNYIGTLDSMDIGYGFAKWLTESEKNKTWKEERARTNHYPVLD